MTMTVTPVIDYEPPTGVPGCLRVARRPGARRRPRIRPAPEPAPLTPRQRDATAFADAVLRALLETLDGRRQPAQLRSLLADGLIDALGSFIRGRPADAEVATLRRVRLQAVDPAESAFEVVAGYARAGRGHAIAGRVAPGPTGWRFTALHIG